MKASTKILLCALLPLAGCVSVTGPAMTKNEIQKGQRTILLVFATPSPVMTAEESNVASAVDLIPGVSQLADSVRDDRNVAISKDVASNLPSWHPAQEFSKLLLKQLQAAGNPGKWVLPADSEIIPDRLAGWTEADNVADWMTKYYGIGPIPPTAPRNYAQVPGISDALIFEANLAWGLDADANGNESPTLSCRARLISAVDNTLLWTQEEVVGDAGFKGSLETLKPNGDILETHWRGLMPQVASKISDDFRKSLLTAGLYAGPAISTAAAMGAGSAPQGGSAYSLSGPSAGTPGASAYTLPAAAYAPQTTSQQAYTLPAAPSAAPAGAGNAGAAGAPSPAPHP